MAPQGGVPGSFHLVALLSLENAVGGVRVCVGGCILPEEQPLTDY